MLDGLVRGVRLVREAAADSGQLVGRHDGALAGPADEHRAISIASLDHLAGVAGDVWEVDGFRAIGPAIDDLVTESFDGGPDFSLQGNPAWSAPSETIIQQSSLRCREIV